MKCTICILLALVCACDAGRFRAANSSNPLKPEVNATAGAAAQTKEANSSNPLKPEVNATAGAAAQTKEANSSIPLKPEVNSTPAATAQVAKAPAAEKDKQMPRKLTMQIPDEEVNTFLSKLSPDCEKQVSAIIGGQGSDLHTFGTPGVEATAESCKNLNGSLCATLAHVFQETQNSSGRQMSTTVEMKGNSCLPQACVSAKDLPLLAGFMHSKAKNSGQIPGEGVELNLHVDCSASGGSVVDTPDDGHAAAEEHAAEEEHSHDEEKHHEDGHKENQKEEHSHEEEHHKEETEKAEEHKEHEHEHGAKSGAFKCSALSLISALSVLSA